jgi:type I restriction enzyme S subunit
VSQWSEVSLGDAAVISRSVVEPRDLPPDTRYLGLEHIERGGRIVGAVTVESEGVSSSKFEFRVGDILYGKLRPYLGKIAAPDFSGVCSTDILPIRPRGTLDRRYLLHYLRQPRIIELANSRATGANLPRLAPMELAKIRIPLPCLAEQKRIAGVLDRADGLRAKRREAIQLLDKLMQSIFLDMFGDPSRNPLNFPMGKVGDLLISANYGSSAKAAKEGDIPVLRMNNITASGGLDMRDLKYLSSEQAPEKYLVRAGDVLFNRTNSAELVGKTAIYRFLEEVAYAGYLVRLRVGRESHPEYLAAFLNSRYAKRVLRSMSKSIVGMANINAKEVQGMAIPIPPLVDQKRFAAAISQVETAKETHRTHLAALDELFTSLQNRAFSGTLWDHDVTGEAT